MTAEPIRIPVEVTSPPPIFDLVPKGYDRSQVDEHLLGLEQEIAELTWERDWVEGRSQELAREAEQLQAERDEFESMRDSWEPSFAKLGERASEIIRLTQAEADALLEASREEASERRTRTEQDVKTAREALEQEIADARADLRNTLELSRREAEAQAQQILHEARQQAAELEATARRDAEAVRIRTVEHLAAARQERAKTATMLAELSERLRSAAERLDESRSDSGAESGAAAGSESGQEGARRRVVVTVTADEVLEDPLVAANKRRRGRAARGRTRHAADLGRSTTTSRRPAGSRGKSGGRASGNGTNGDTGGGTNGGTNGTDDTTNT